MSELLNTQNLIALLTLTAMEVVLGIDNLIFIAILVGKLPEQVREKARRLGIGLALGTRIGLLFSISWVMSLTQPLFEVFERQVSGRDLILLLGGTFLIGKATLEIHEKLETNTEHSDAHSRSANKDSAKSSLKRASFTQVLAQITVLDIVFSLDSVITAVGMADQILIMVIAMLVSVGVMLIAAKSVGDFVERHPTVKILALSFLLMIGAMLLMEGMGLHVNKGYIYFAMGFAFLIELANMRLRKIGKH